MSVCTKVWNYMFKRYIFVVKLTKVNESIGMLYNEVMAINNTDILCNM